KRFAKHPANHQSLEFVRLLESPKALNQIYYNSLEELQQQRLKLDETIIKWCDELSESDISYPLQYNRMSGEPNIKALDSLMIHFFNHQTHHRGQLTTLFSQEGLDVGVTDFLMLIPDESASL
ncbi:MAG: DinB family protein, partial [Coleofasciculaceae cyanobacterium]